MLFHRLGSLWKVMLPRHRHSNAKVERCSKKLPKTGSRPPQITSAAENQFIFDLLLKQKNVMYFGAWLGLHRKADTKFYWADDTPLTGYTAWNSGEPNSPETEKCGQIYGTGHAKGKWNDKECTLFNSEIKLGPVLPCQKTSK